MAIIKSGQESDHLNINPGANTAKVTLYDSVGREVSYQRKATFMATNTFTPVATPTDLVTIIGSPSKVVRVISFIITATNTAAGSQQFFLLKRNSKNSGGTYIPGNLTPLDSIEQSTADAGHWTANPLVLGNLVGNLNIIRVASTVLVPGSFGTVSPNPRYDLIRGARASLLDKFITLRGQNELLAINFAGVALVAGQTHAYSVVWIEE